MNLAETLHLAGAHVRHISITLFSGWASAGVGTKLAWIWYRGAGAIGLKLMPRCRLHPHQVNHALTVGLRNSSDLYVFNQIFIHQEYRSLDTLEDVSFVLDLGANVGYASAWFLSRFPNARVLAVEPDERNIEVCRMNLEPYAQRATTLHGAAWSETTSMSLAQDRFGDGREWSTQVVVSETNSGQIQAWDVATLIEMAAFPHIDLLKVDIERAELAVFGETAQRWLPKVRNLCVELHGADCEAALFNALSGYDFDLKRDGELTICTNLRQKKRVA
jgi:FkbM family methyltransferase